MCEKEMKIDYRNCCQKYYTLLNAPVTERKKNINKDRGKKEDICGLKINLQVSARCLLELNDEIVEYYLR